MGKIPEIFNVRNELPSGVHGDVWVNLPIEGEDDEPEQYKKFKEEDHPRDSDGKFASGRSSSGSKKNNKKANRKMFSDPTYTAVELDKKARKQLVEAMGKRIPVGWTLHAHHMTMHSGSPETEDDTGSSHNLKAVAWGRNKTSMAVKIKGGPDSDFDKHVTIAVSPRGKARHANDITEWRPMMALNLQGTVKDLVKKNKRWRVPNWSGPSSKASDTTRMESQAVKTKESSRDRYKPVTKWPGYKQSQLAHGEAPKWLLDEPIRTTEMEKEGGRTAAIEKRKSMGIPPRYDEKGMPYYTSQPSKYRQQGMLFEESQHPRDAEGKFSEKASSTKPKAAKTKRKKRKPPTKAELERRAIKYRRVARLEAKRDYLIGRTTRDMRSRDKEKADAAAVMRLILNTGMRPGYRGAGAEVPSYGASTLLAKHVDTSGGDTVLKFKGKKQVDQAVSVSDRQLASFLEKRARDKAKQGADTPLFNVRESQLLKYAKNITGGTRYKVKDFRTMTGTMEARKKISSLDTPKNKKEYKKLIKEVATHVAGVLGNTPAICLQAYIDPLVFGEWKNAAAIE